MGIKREKTNRLVPPRGAHLNAGGERELDLGVALGLHVALSVHEAIVVLLEELLAGRMRLDLVLQVLVQGLQNNERGAYKGQRKRG